LIPKQTIDEIFDAAIIEDVIGEFVPLKKRGANFLGNCPFHNEKTPSFTVSPAKGIYKCFGCGKAGNAVNFIMEHEHYNYPEALRFLANKYNIEIEEEEQTDEQKVAANERESLYIVSNFAANYFKKQLHETDTGRAIALSYFVERGFRADIIEKFQLGYNPDEWTAFTDAAEKEGHILKFLDKAGLSIVKGDKKFDRFKGRVIFPIHNLSGRVLGFGGRILKTDKKTAKYLNSPESEIYHKSKVLYGIYFAKKTITQQNNCYLVEGYTDVISLFQAGVENVVASSGTSLTEGQIRLIKRFTPNITILYDGDAAGLKASFRGIDMILHEDMNVRVVLFPEGDDPDSYAKNHTTEELKNYITANAQDFIRFKTAVLIKDVGNDPIKKAELFTNIAQSISAISGATKRSTYIKETSEHLNVPEDAFLNEVNKYVGKRQFNEFKQQQKNVTQEEVSVEFPTQSDVKQATKLVFNDLAYVEREIIRLLINFGDKTINVEVINEKEEQVLTAVTVALFLINSIHNEAIAFENEVYQKIYNFYADQLSKGQLPVNKYFINHHDKEISQLAISLLATKYELSPNWGKHKIKTPTEDKQLDKAVIHALYAFQLSKLNQLIYKNEVQLKVETDEDNLLILLQEQVRFQRIKKQLAKKLGRVILK